MIDPRAEAAVTQLSEQIRTAFGADLVSVTLYGSAVNGDFVPGRSNLNFAIVLDRLTFAHLKALHRYLPKWHKLGMATPLLLDRAFIARGADVFPMEFHDIKAQHQVLFGEEIFSTLAIDARHLRYQAEHEVRGKLLRLRALYAEVGAERQRLEGLMLDSVKTFLIVMRNFLRVRSVATAARYTGVLDQFEAHFHVQLPTMRHLLAVKLGTARWASDIEPTFAAYLLEVERLAEVVDHLHPHNHAEPPPA